MRLLRPSTARRHWNTTEREGRLSADTLEVCTQTHLLARSASKKFMTSERRTAATAPPRASQQEALHSSTTDRTNICVRQLLPASLCGYARRLARQLHKKKLLTSASIVTAATYTRKHVHKRTRTHTHAHTQTHIRGEWDNTEPKNTLRARAAWTHSSASNQRHRIFRHIVHAWIQLNQALHSRCVLWMRVCGRIARRTRSRLGGGGAGAHPEGTRAQWRSQRLQAPAALAQQCTCPPAHA